MSRITSSHDSPIIFPTDPAGHQTSNTLKVAPHSNDIYKIRRPGFASMNVSAWCLSNHVSCRVSAWCLYIVFQHGASLIMSPIVWQHSACLSCVSLVVPLYDVSCRVEAWFLSLVCQRGASLITSRCGRRGSLHHMTLLSYFQQTLQAPIKETSTQAIFTT